MGVRWVGGVGGLGWARKGRRWRRVHVGAEGSCCSLDQATTRNNSSSCSRGVLAPRSHLVPDADQEHVEGEGEEGDPFGHAAARGHDQGVHCTQRGPVAVVVAPPLPPPGNHPPASTPPPPSLTPVKLLCCHERARSPDSQPCKEEGSAARQAWHTRGWGSDCGCARVLRCWRAPQHPPRTPLGHPRTPPCPHPQRAHRCFRYLQRWAGGEGGEPGRRVRVSAQPTAAAGHAKTPRAALALGERRGQACCSPIAEVGRGNAQRRPCGGHGGQQQDGSPSKPGAWVALFVGVGWGEGWHVRGEREPLCPPARPARPPRQSRGVRWPTRMVARTHARTHGAP